jgi:GAF domain-containing protein
MAVSPSLGKFYVIWHTVPHEGGRASLNSPVAASADDLIEILDEISRTGSSTVIPAAPAEQAILRRFEALHRVLDDYRQRERDLTALHKIAVDLTGLHDSEQLLKAIVHRARILVGADVGYLSILNVEQGVYHVRATDGTISPQFPEIEIPQGLGLLGLVDRERIPFFTSDYASDQRFPHSAATDEVMAAEGIVSLLGIPLVANGRLAGVFFIGDRFSRKHAPKEIAILSLLAELATLALENARLIEEIRATNERLEAQTSEVLSAARAHEQMTELVTQGGSAADLKALLATLLACRIHLLDHDLRPMAGAELRQALSESRRIGRSVLIETGARYRRIVALNGGEELLGALLLDAPELLSASAVRTFERGALVTSIVLMSEERSAQRAYFRNTSFLTALLRTPQVDHSGLSEEASRLNVPEEGTHLVIADLIGGRMAPVLRRLREHQLHARAIIGEHDGYLVLLSRKDAPDSLARTLLEELEAAGAGASNVVFSRPAQGLAQFPGLFASGRKTLALMCKLGQSGMVRDDARLGVFTLVLEGQGREEIESYIESTVGKLLRKDRTSNSDLAGTLLTYFDKGYNSREAAASLRIHVNTLRQRLDTITGLLGDWQRDGRAFEIHTALKIHDLQREFSGRARAPH